MKLSLGMDGYIENMRERGWVVLEKAIDATLIDRMLDDLDRAWETCREVMIRNGVASDADSPCTILSGKVQVFSVTSTRWNR